MTGDMIDDPLELAKAIADDPDPRADLALLAATVIEQNEELVALRAETEEYRTSGQATRAHLRLAHELYALRDALREALDEWQAARDQAPLARIAELRQLLLPFRSTKDLS